MKTKSLCKNCAKKGKCGTDPACYKYMTTCSEYTSPPIVPNEELEK